MSHYLHGTDPAEQKRLSRLNQLINTRCLDKIKLEIGSKILDVGSGLGQMTFQFCRVVGESGHCVGIERDINQLEEARKNHVSPNLEFRLGDALKPYLENAEAGTFDFVHGRFLLEHLATPATAVKEMAKALKSGGRIWLADDDHQQMVLYPEPTGFQALWNAYIESYVEVGNDPFIGRKLPQLLKENGFKNVTNDLIFFGDCAGTETFQFFVDNLIGVITPSSEIMISSKLISEREFSEGINRLKEWSTLPNAAIWYSICVAEGVKV